MNSANNDVKVCAAECARTGYDRFPVWTTAVLRDIGLETDANRECRGYQTSSHDLRLRLRSMHQSEVLLSSEVDCRGSSSWTSAMSGICVDPHVTRYTRGAVREDQRASHCIDWLIWSTRPRLWWREPISYCHGSCRVDNKLLPHLKEEIRLISTWISLKLSHRPHCYGLHESNFGVLALIRCFFMSRNASCIAWYRNGF